MLKTCILSAIFIISVNSEEKCETFGEEGTCKDLVDCPGAAYNLKYKINPPVCYFNATSRIPVVCCRDEIPNRLKFLSLKKKGCDFISQVNNELPKDMERGKKAWAKCLEYQRSAVFPCRDIQGSMRVVDVCHYDHNRYVPIAAGGIDASLHDFRHMALLGYGAKFEEAEWLCGGTLISEKFILTAGHCISSRDYGKVTFAALGLIRRSAIPYAEGIYSIARIIKYPDYTPSLKYNDIALLETDRRVEFNRQVIPACLYIGNEVQDQRVQATGWGALGHKKENADVLQNVPLWKVSDEECSAKFPPHRLYPRGYDNATQMCYGDDGRPRDTCGGDSGGPIQINNPDIYCMHLIIGVTSFGNSNCAQVGRPGMYTRLSYYVPWIESIVWPE